MTPRRIDPDEQERLYREAMGRDAPGQGEAPRRPRSDPAPLKRPSREEAAARRDKGMSSVDANADEEWKNAARQIILDLPLGHEFLGEDIRGMLDAAGFSVHDKRALGPVINSAHRAGYIESIGWRNARTSNLSPKVLWRRK